MGGDKWIIKALPVEGIKFQLINWTPWKLFKVLVSIIGSPEIVLICMIAFPINEQKVIYSHCRKTQIMHKKEKIYNFTPCLNMLTYFYPVLFWSRDMYLSSFFTFFPPFLTALFLLPLSIFPDHHQTGQQNQKQETWLHPRVESTCDKSIPLLE